MMAKITFQGMDEYVLRMERLAENPEAMCKELIYEAAGIVADTVKNGIRSLPVDNRRGSPDNPIAGVTAKQKADLIDGLGLAPIENNNGYINTKLGFDGYGSTKSKKYPKGLPNVLLMRSVESGTSFRRKNPVVRKSVNASRKKAIQAMQEKCDEICKKIME